MWREVGKDSRGNTLFVEDNEVGGKRYWSDEIGGGVVVWDTALVSPEMLRLALADEEITAEEELRDIIRDDYNKEN
jgi:hypothetical protein